MQSDPLSQASSTPEGESRRGAERSSSCRSEPEQCGRKNSGRDRFHQDRIEDALPCVKRAASSSRDRRDAALGRFFKDSARNEAIEAYDVRRDQPGHTTRAMRSPTIPEGEKSPSASRTSPRDDQTERPGPNPPREPAITRGAGMAFR